MNAQEAWKMPYFVRGTSIEPRYCPNVEWQEKLNPDVFRTILYPMEERIDPKMWNRIAVLRSSHKRLPDFFVVNACPIVGESFRGIVENLEPNVHQFIEVSIVDKRGAHRHGPFYLFMLLREIDSIIPEESNISIRRRFVGGKEYLTYIERGDPNFTLNSSIVGRAHIWREKMWSTGWFMSDTFAEGLRDLKLTEKRSGLETLQEAVYNKV